MKKSKVNELPNGVYRVYWKESHGGGYSLASIGRLYDGTVWMACSNWICEIDSAIQTTNFKPVKKVELIEKRF